MRKQLLKLDDINTSFFAIDNTIYWKTRSDRRLSLSLSWEIEEIYRDEIILNKFFHLLIRVVRVILLRFKVF